VAASVLMSCMFIMSIISIDIVRLGAVYITSRMRTSALLIVRFLIALALIPVAMPGWAQGNSSVIRVGAFPNLTHAQPMIGKANGWFDKAMGPQVKIQWTSFNAGPSAIEALFAGAIDMTYVGPNPAINGYVRSNGEALRVVAGAASGGASLVVRNDAGINNPEDFHGKRVASPQFGNTQDVALRNWLKQHGMKSNDKGGDVRIIPMANPDQLTLFLKKDLDAAWAPEPWATRLIREGNGRLFVDERTLWPNGQFVIGLLVVNTKFLKAHPELVKNWIRANVDLTDWINAHQSEAKTLLNQQIQRETGKALPPAVLEDAFSRLQFTYDPLHGALTTAAKQAFDAGFLGREMPDLSGLYDLTLLNQVLAEKKRKAIQ
jgi:NitT/TauT family transport system substrate-binding protein